MPGNINTLYIMGADARGVVLGANQAQQAMNGMVSHANQVNRKLATANQGIFNQTAQYAFAAQDVITVLSMGGGWSRALLSAANNIAFVVSAAGTMKGALASVAITLGAVFLPKMLAAVSGIRDMREELAKLTAEQMRAFQAEVGIARQRTSLTQNIIGAGNGDPANRVEELRNMQQQQRDLLEQEQAGQRAMRRQMMLQVQEASRLQDQAVKELQSGLSTPGNQFGSMPLSISQALTNIRRIGVDFFGSGQSNVEQQAAAAQETLRQMEMQMAASTMTAAEYAHSLERIGIALGKADHAMRASVGPKGFLQGISGGIGLTPEGPTGMRAAANLQLGLHGRMERARQREIADLEIMTQLHEQILDLQTRQVSLVMKGSTGHAQEMQRLRQSAFDSSVGAARETDANLQRAIDRLNNAIANGVRFVPVK